MKPHRQNALLRCILRVIDVFVAAYLLRPVHWEKEPFEKATRTDWRIGWFFAAGLPISLLITSGNNFVHSFFETAGDPRHPIVWLYVAVIGIISFGALVVFKIAPKIPLGFSIPTAVAAWIYCIWLLGFHSEKLIHSS